MELNLITQFIALATITTIVTESIKGPIDVLLTRIDWEDRAEFISDFVQKALPIVIGIMLSFNVNIDIFNLFNIDVDSVIFGQVISGFIISIGANGVYDMFKSVMGYESKD